MEKLCVKADMSQLAVVEKYVEDQIRPACSGDERLQIGLVVEELFVNIVQHAYPSGAGMVKIRCRADATQGKFDLFVEDEGIPFNLLDAKLPDLSSDLQKREVGALGIYLIRCCMDEITYQRLENRNVLRLTKEIQKHI